MAVMVAAPSCENLVAKRQTHDPRDTGEGTLSTESAQISGSTGNRHGVIDAHDKHRPVTQNSCQQVDGHRDGVPEPSGERSPLGVLMLDPGGCLSGSFNSCRRGDLNPHAH